MRLDPGNEVDVVGRPNAARGLVCEQQARDHAAGEHDLVAELAEALSDPADHRQMQFRDSGHGFNLRSISLPASSRSRARPARRASTSASSSYRISSRPAACGADR